MILFDAPTIKSDDPLSESFKKLPEFFSSIAENPNESDADRLNAAYTLRYRTKNEEYSQKACRSISENAKDPKTREGATDILKDPSFSSH